MKELNQTKKNINKKWWCGRIWKGQPKVWYFGFIVYIDKITYSVLGLD